MAQHDFLASLSRGMHRPCGFRIQHPRLARLISIGVIILFGGVPVIAQTSQHVYGSTASQLSAYSVGADGTLSTLSAPGPAEAFRRASQRARLPPMTCN